MSHVVDCDIVIKDLPAFKEACKEIGLEFRENQKNWRWYGQWMNDYDAEDAAYKAGIKPEDYGKCVHAAGVPNDNSAYELGLVPNPHGEGFCMVFDFYGHEGGKLQKVIGEAGAKLKTEYSLKVLDKQSKKRGYKIGNVKRRANGLIEEVEIIKKW